MNAKFRSFLKICIPLVLILTLAITSVVLAVSISGDTDTLALEAPHANNLTVTQKGGTTVQYPFSAVINNTGNEKNDVFPGTVTVSISKNGGWLASVSTNSFNFTDYNSPQTGIVEISVPCGATGTKVTSLDLEAAASTNGNSLTPISVNLSYTITAGLDDPSCTPPPPSDNTPPQISYKLNPASPDGSNGWYKSNITLTWTVTENESPISLKTTGCEDQSITTDQGETSYSCSATSDGGSAGPVIVSIKRDATAPDVTVTPDRDPDQNGWYNAPVVFDTAGKDVTSGVDDTKCTDDQTYSVPDGTALTVGGSCTDNAGNVGNGTSTAFNFDDTNPTLTWNDGPAAGGSYYFGFVPAVPTCSANDSTSGPDSCGVTGYDTTVGSHTMTATAKDLAGNSYNETRTYTVLAWTLNGFYQPVDMGGVWNTVKGGSTVPFKFNVFAGPTELTDTNIVHFTATKTLCTGGTEDDVKVTSTGGTSLRYDTVAKQFVYNWQTLKQPGYCFVVKMTTDDGSSLSANFKLK